MNSISSIAFKGKQSGAVLITGLVFLVLLTLIGVTAMATTTLEEKMAGNSREQNLSFQAAEAALRDAWADIISGRIQGATKFTADCLNGLCLPANSTNSDSSDDLPPWERAGVFSGSPSVQYGTYSSATPVGKVSTQPRYLIEVIPAQLPGGSLKVGATTNYVYRVTTRAWGANSTTQTTLQAVFKQ